MRSRLGKPLTILFSFFLSVSFVFAAEIGGTVRDKKSGHGIAHVLVRAIPVESSEAVFEGYTDRDGSYILKVPRGRYRVQAAPRGTNYLPGYYRNPKNPDELGVVELVAEDVFGFADISLDLGGSIAGRVTRAADGVPLENVRVSAESESFRSVAVTDRNGRYLLRALPPEFYAVEAGVLDSNYIPTYYPQVTFAEQAERVQIAPGDIVSGIDIKLNYGARIRGRILSATTNQPLSSIMAIAVPVSGDQPERFAYSDPNGFFTINGLGGGKYRVEAGNERGESPEGAKQHRYVTEYFDRAFDQELAKPVEVASAATVSGVDFHLFQSNHIQGRVRSTFTNGPMSDVVVRPVLPAESKLPLPTAVTASDGTYELDNLPPGKYSVTVSLPDPDKQYVATWYHDQIARENATQLKLEDGDTYQNVDFNLRLGGNITGKAVVDDPEYPVEFGNLHVELSAVGNELPGFEPRVYDFSPDGRYEIDGAPMGRFQLAVTSEDPNFMVGNSSTTKTVVVNEGRELNGVDFLLHVGGSISGHVTLKRSHLPIDKYRILALRMNEPYYEFVTIKDHRYTVAGLQPGKYIVVLVEAVEPLTLEKLFSGPRWYDSQIVEVKKGTATANVDFTILETHPPTIPQF